MASPDVGALNREALLNLLGSVAGSPPAPPAVQQPGALAPGGYDAPLRVEGARPDAPPPPVDRLKPTPPPSKPLASPVLRTKPSPFFDMRGR